MGSCYLDARLRSKSKKDLCALHVILTALQVLGPEVDVRREWQTDAKANMERAHDDHGDRTAWLCFKNLLIA